MLRMKVSAEHTVCIAIAAKNKSDFNNQLMLKRYFVLNKFYFRNKIFLNIFIPYRFNKI